ncbi:50S ribosomal L9 C-terminal domain-containing protein, partial [Brevibacterium paucivorans]
PRGWAQLWTAGAEKQVEALRKARQARQIADREEAIALKEKLEATTAVADALKEAVGHEFDRRQIALPKHIKEAGSYTATVRVHDEITANAKFDVIGKA